MKIWRKIIHSHTGKGIALLLAGSLLSDLLMPTLSLALTGGPSQPEFQGFAEIGVSNMVDPFTGDFSYEIPLMTVPGPNGGYPINLNYAAGASMEDEASWVGLGWNLNPGAINRNMRGVPDDFSGPQKDKNGNQLVSTSEADVIHKSVFTKDNVTVGVGLGLVLPIPEIATVDLGNSSSFSVSPNVNLYYNTYKGVGFRAGIGMKLPLLSQEGGSGGLSAGLNLGFDSNDGASLQPSLSLSGTNNDRTTGVTIGFGYNSRQGITNTFLQTSQTRKLTKLASLSTPVGDIYFKSSHTRSSGNSVSFAASSGVPGNPMAMSGFNTGFNLDFEAGAMQSELNIPVNFSGMLSVQKVKDWMADGYDYPTYGTMYSGYRSNPDLNADRALMDYNREKDAAINLKLPMMPLPVMTHDVYSVTGAGIAGSFRTFRNDVGTFYEPRVSSDFLGVTLGVEVAASTGFKAGIDPTVNFSHSYSGKWKSDDDQLTGTNFFRKKDHFINNNVAAQQPFDFRFTNELTAHTPGDNRFSTLGGNGAVNYTLFPATADFPDLSETEYEDPDAQTHMKKFFPFKNLSKFKPKASNKLSGTPVLESQTLRTQKERRIQMVEYRTKGEIQLTGQPYLPSVFVTDPSQVMPPKSAFALTQNEIKKHHVTEFSVVQAGGMRYVYGLPLYNRKHEEYYFAIPPGTPANSKTVTVSGLSSLVTSGRKGRHGDKYFTATKISPYAHSYLITHIVSPDYIDLDNNGPSDNDYGYWTKFNYRPIKTYGWRVPVEQDQANYIEGYASSPNDDKATFTYGERDMTYLHSVETKTHVAVFYVSDREDARGSSGLNGGATGEYSQKLDRIVLYAKNNLTKPLKSVYFEYTYDLCKQVSNNPNSRGKLTLKCLYFQYGDSPKGALAPYKFEYGAVYTDRAGSIDMVNSGLNGNPDYAMQDVDRWGSYKEPQGVSNLDNPYVEQALAGSDRRLESAAAWNLTDITLPTGAKINIAYEADDYAYVQDKPATEMYRIAGMGQTNGSDDKWLANGPALITDAYKRVYFHLDDQTTQVSDVKRMLDELPDGKIYFKTWQRLQVPKGEPQTGWVHDYVNGYAPVLKNAGSYGIAAGPGNLNYGYFTLANDPSGPASAQNFFRKAGLQYLRHQRADLDMPQNQSSAALQAAAMIISAIPVIVQALQMIQGYYSWAVNKGHCQYIGNAKPSYVKLGCADGVKYGGGHRVRKITISDVWNDLTPAPSATYGMEYHYRTEDESGRLISSGVASYEPLIGGEENPLKKAHYYGPDNKYAVNDPAFFLEEPFGESYFPAPVVGYSKTVIVNLANHLNIKTGDGINCKEFYTARDFPIKTGYTAQPQRIEDKQTVFIPIIATIQFKGYGYSQGYYIELNDMHGKPKAETLYDADFWDVTVGNWNVDNPPFVNKKIYRYKASGKDLINTVDVLDGDQQVRTAVMGESSEMFSEMKEDFGYSMSAGAQLNAGVDPVPLGIFVSGYPNFEYSESSARTLVTTKVVYKNGILEETIDMAEGAVKKTKNLLYDTETGMPLLTVVTSDFDNPDPDQDINDQYIYNYTYPAHWHYGGMQATYRNYRNIYKFSGTGTFPDADKYMQEGDELLSSAGTRLWVKSVTGNNIIIVDNTGATVYPNGTYVTLRSGKHNQQTVSAGSLSSLANPVGGYKNAFLEFYNTHVSNNPTYSSVLGSGQSTNLPFSFSDCADPSRVYSGKLYLGYDNPIRPTVEFRVNSGNPECDNLIFDIPPQILALGFVPAKAKFSYYDRQNVLFTYTHAPGSVYKIPVPIVPKCHQLNFCLDGILNASADEFSDNWTYGSEFNPPGPVLNDYLQGRRGIWRKLRANAYFSERKQRKATVPQAGEYDTYIGRDGTYERFVVFDWINNGPNPKSPVGNTDNVQAPLGWRWQAEITPKGYSPYGFEIENRNALDIYSAELYGYGHSLVMASAQEAAYPEIGFDGFEELPPSSNYAKNGHLQILTAGPVMLSIEPGMSHSGNHSLKVLAINAGRIYLRVPVSSTYANFLRNGTVEMLRNHSYLVGFWYRFNGTPTGPLKLDAFDGSSNFQSFTIGTASPAIEGWRRAEFEVKTSLASASTASIELRINVPQGANMLIDDLRIHPANAAFKSFVYNRDNFLLMAILDDNNYASFYDYDEENTLIQVKKETEEGVRTIQTTRKNVKR